MGFFIFFFFRLKRSYREHAASLHQTGGGLRDGDIDREVHHEYADCYIPASGPDLSTTERTKNIWGAQTCFFGSFCNFDKDKLDKITKDFPFFPELHRLFSTRPNITPIAVTTAIGPDGPRTIHYQAPDNVGGGPRPEPVIDPQLLALEAPVPPQLETQPAQPILGNSNHINLPPTAQRAENAMGHKTPARAPKTSNFGSEKLDSAVSKARESINTIPSKRSSGIEDTFTKMAM